MNTVTKSSKKKIPELCKINKFTIPNNIHNNITNLTNMLL
jgi:hypothetical protein